MVITGSTEDEAGRSVIADEKAGVYCWLRH
jgi:hypothetical protein